MRSCYNYARYWSVALGGRAIAPGDRVRLWGPNSAERIACFWGILLRGATVVPMDPAASRDFVERAVHDASVNLIVRDRQLAGALPSLVNSDRKEVSLRPEPGLKTQVPPAMHQHAAQSLDSLHLGNDPSRAGWF